MIKKLRNAKVRSDAYCTPDYSLFWYQPRITIEGIHFVSDKKYNYFLVALLVSFICLVRTKKIIRSLDYGYMRFRLKLLSYKKGKVVFGYRELMKTEQSYGGYMTADRFRNKVEEAVL